MGMCLCKDKNHSSSSHNVHNGGQSTERNHSLSSQTTHPITRTSDGVDTVDGVIVARNFTNSEQESTQSSATTSNVLLNVGDNHQIQHEQYSSEGQTANNDVHQSSRRIHIRSIKSLVLETLALIRTLVDNEQDTPRSMITLHKIADHESGWLEVVHSLIEVIPMHDPLGPTVITLLLDECPLPSKKAISRLCSSLKLCHCLTPSSKKDVCRHRNICLVLGCLAEKMAGPSSISLLTKDVIDYLLSNLNVLCDSPVILYSLIALEKFSQTSENKFTICRHLNSKDRPDPIEVLEQWWHNDEYIKREIGFCAVWCLDNLFLKENRPFSHEQVNTDDLTVMLNNKDVSEYLKISADGLQARCDASSFESVRCTFQVDEGVWYYEVLIVTAGVMQIGWATKDSKFLNYDGYGIGDDEFSIAYDGCRQLVWYNASSEAQIHPCWKAGDVLGVLLDLEKHEVVFTLNGNSLPAYRRLFQHAKSRFFAAASFMSFQQCEFNFGNRTFLYPPSQTFSRFNDYGTMTAEEKVILPKHKQLELLRQVQVHEDSCTLCFDNHATVTILPCKHRGFCMSCAKQVQHCPMCRQVIIERIESNVEDSHSNDTAEVTEVPEIPDAPDTPELPEEP